jgi:hypothetical protein
MIRKAYGDLDKRFRTYTEGKAHMTLPQFVHMLTEERVLAADLLTQADIRGAHGSALPPCPVPR